MQEKEIQKSLEEQLEILKKQQEEAEKMYKGRMEMGLLASDPAALQELAKTITERQQRINKLEYQISQKGEIVEEQQEGTQTFEENEQQPQEMALTEYSNRNPIINWLQRAVNKLEQWIQKSEQKRDYRKGNRLPTEPKIARTKMDEYQDIIDTDFINSQSKVQVSQTRKSWELIPEQLKRFREAETKIAENYNARQPQMQVKEKSDSLLR